MRFKINETEIFFPFDSIYPEQKAYITELINLFKNPGHALLEMPSGTGKTISLLSACISFVNNLKMSGRFMKIVYCTRTLAETNKTLEELKFFCNTFPEFRLLGIGLAGRKNLCVNDEALNNDVDLVCRKLINLERCEFYNNLVDIEDTLGGSFKDKTHISSGVDSSHLRDIDNNPSNNSIIWTLDEIRAKGKEKKLCPYFLLRRLIKTCDILVYTYNYLVDPSIYDAVSKEIGKDAIIIFDEAHNIDNYCIEGMSVEIKRNTLDNAMSILKSITKNEQEKGLVAKNEQEKGLVAKNEQEKGLVTKNEEERVLVTKNSPSLKELDKIIPPRLNSDAASENKQVHLKKIPGSLRKTKHFISVMKRLVEFFKTKLKTTHLTTETPSSFISTVQSLTFVDKRTLLACSQRLSLINNEDLDLRPLKLIADFVSTASATNQSNIINSTEYVVIFEPWDTFAPSVFNPVLRLYCVDPSIALKNIFKKFRNVVITSGTLSPIEAYPRMLVFVPAVIKEFDVSLGRNAISPIVVTKGNDQLGMSALKNINEGICENNEYEVLEKGSASLTSSYSLRTEPSVVRNYGTLILELSKSVPDGLICFFPSYAYMEDIISLWSESNFINEFSKSKVIFVESPSATESIQAMENYRKAILTGRGAILMAVARGKASEGVDFKGAMGRCVVLIGVPYQFMSERTKQRVLHANMPGFLAFDAVRHAAQCLGRVLRSKNDYGLMIMADTRYLSLIKSMPKWIRERIEPGMVNLSVDMSVVIAKRFYKEMAQYF